MNSTENNFIPIRLQLQLQNQITSPAPHDEESPD
jgi:hypothetical protein